MEEREAVSRQPRLLPRQGHHSRPAELTAGVEDGEWTLTPAGQVLTLEALRQVAVEPQDPIGFRLQDRPEGKDVDHAPVPVHVGADFNRLDEDRDGDRRTDGHGHGRSGVVLVPKISTRFRSMFQAGMEKGIRVSPSRRLPIRVRTERWLMSAPWHAHSTAA